MSEIEVRTESPTQYMNRVTYACGPDRITFEWTPNGGGYLNSNIRFKCEYCGKERCYLECEESQEQMVLDGRENDMLNEAAQHREWDASCDAVEILLMNLASAGMDMTDQQIADAVFSSLEGLSNSVL